MEKRNIITITKADNNGYVLETDNSLLAFSSPDELLVGLSEYLKREKKEFKLAKPPVFKPGKKD